MSKITNIDDLVRKTGYALPPEDDGEWADFTEKILNLLQPNEAYEFSVILNVQRYSAPKIAPSDFGSREEWREYLVKHREEFYKPQLESARNLFKSVGAKFPDLKPLLGGIVSGNLTAEQVKELQNNELVKKITAYYPYPNPEPAKYENP